MRYAHAPLQTVGIHTNIGISSGSNTYGVNQNGINAKSNKSLLSALGHSQNFSGKAIGCDVRAYAHQNNELVIKLSARFV